MGFKKSNAALQMMGLMGMMAMSQDTEYNYLEREPIEIQPKPPRGTSEYFFNAMGEFSTGQMLKEDVVFYCYAINDKNAIKKFNRWDKH